MLIGICDNEQIEVEFDYSNCIEMIQKYGKVSPSITIEDMKAILDRGGIIQINHFAFYDKVKRNERLKKERGELSDNKSE